MQQAASFSPGSSITAEYRGARYAAKVGKVHLVDASRPPQFTVHWDVDGTETRGSQELLQMSHRNAQDAATAGASAHAPPPAVTPGLQLAAAVVQRYSGLDARDSGHGQKGAPAFGRSTAQGERDFAKMPVGPHIANLFRNCARCKTVADLMLQVNLTKALGILSFLVVDPTQARAIKDSEGFMLFLEATLARNTRGVPDRLTVEDNKSKLVDMTRTLQASNAIVWPVPTAGCGYGPTWPNILPPIAFVPGLAPPEAIVPLCDLLTESGPGAAYPPVLTAEVLAEIVRLYMVLAAELHRVCIAANVTVHAQPYDPASFTFLTNQERILPEMWPAQNSLPFGHFYQMVAVFEAVRNMVQTGSLSQLVGSMRDTSVGQHAAVWAMTLLHGDVMIAKWPHMANIYGVALLLLRQAYTVSKCWHEQDHSLDAAPRDDDAPVPLNDTRVQSKGGLPLMHLLSLAIQQHDGILVVLREGISHDGIAGLEVKQEYTVHGRVQAFTWAEDCCRVSNVFSAAMSLLMPPRSILSVQQMYGACSPENIDPKQLALRAFADSRNGGGLPWTRRDTNRVKGVVVAALPADHGPRERHMLSLTNALDGTMITFDPHVRANLGAQPDLRAYDVAVADAMLSLILPSGFGAKSQLDHWFTLAKMAQLDDLCDAMQTVAPAAILAVLKTISPGYRPAAPPAAVGQGAASQGPPSQASMSLSATTPGSTDVAPPHLTQPPTSGYRQGTRAVGSQESPADVHDPPPRQPVRAPGAPPTAQGFPNGPGIPAAPASKPPAAGYAFGSGRAHVAAGSSLPFDVHRAPAAVTAPTPASPGAEGTKRKEQAPGSPEEETKALELGRQKVRTLEAQTSNAQLAAQVTAMEAQNATQAASLAAAAKTAAALKAQAEAALQAETAAAKTTAALQQRLLAAQAQAQKNAVSAAALQAQPTTTVQPAPPSMQPTLTQRAMQHTTQGQAAAVLQQQATFVQHSAQSQAMQTQNLRALQAQQAASLQSTQAQQLAAAQAGATAPLDAAQLLIQQQTAQPSAQQPQPAQPTAAANPMAQLLTQQRAALAQLQAQQAAAVTQLQTAAGAPASTPAQAPTLAPATTWAAAAMGQQLVPVISNPYALSPPPSCPSATPPGQGGAPVQQPFGANARFMPPAPFMHQGQPWTPHQSDPMWNAQAPYMMGGHSGPQFKTAGAAYLQGPGSSLAQTQLQSQIASFGNPSAGTTSASYAPSMMATTPSTPDVALATTGSSGWMPGRDSRIARGSSPGQEYELQLWQKALANPHALRSGHMQSSAAAFAQHAQRLPAPKVMTQLVALFLEQFAKVGSHAGPQRLTEFLQAWTNVLELQRYVDPPPALQAGYTMLSYRLEQLLQAAKLTANSVQQAVQQAYTQVATSSYAAGFEPNFWIVLPVIQAPILAAVGCATAEITIQLCVSMGHAPTAQSHELQQQRFMRFQAVNTQDTSRSSRDPSVGKVPAAELQMDTQKLEGLNKAFQSAHPHDTIAFLMSMDHADPEAVIHAIQLVQRNDCPAIVKQGIMFFMKRANLSAYADLQPMSDFQDARTRRARDMLQRLGIPITDARVVSLALCRPGSCGIRSPFSATHRITVQISKDTNMRHEDLCVALNKECTLFRQYGWGMEQAWAHDYDMVVEETRMAHDELSSAECFVKTQELNGTARLTDLMLQLFKFRSSLVVRYANEFVLQGLPFPSLFTSANLRSIFAHEPFYRNLLESVIVRTRKMCEDEVNPVSKGKGGQDLTKMLQANSATMASLNKQLAVLTAAGKIDAKALAATAAAAKAAAKSVRKTADAAAAAAVAVPGAALVDGAAAKAAAKAKKSKGPKPPPPVAAPKKIVFQLPAKPSSGLKTTKLPDGVFPPKRFTSMGLATREQTKDWKHKPPAYTSTDLAITASLFHDWYMDPKLSGDPYRGDTCFYDLANEDRPCGAPHKCMCLTDPSKPKLHPNGADETTRAGTRAALIAECLVDVEAGYLGYTSA